MSTIAFLDIAMHGRVNPTLPIVAELVRRGHTVSYHTSPAFGPEVERTGATVRLYAGGDQGLSDPPTPIALLEGLGRTAVQVLPGVLRDLRAVRPDLIVHDAACLWGAIAARELRQRYDVRGLPLVNLGNIRQALNLVYTSRTFQPGTEAFDDSFRFVGPSIGARPPDLSFSFDALQDRVVYVSMGTVFAAAPQLLRILVTALAPLAETVVVASGQTDPSALPPLPANVLVRRSSRSRRCWPGRPCSSRTAG